MASNSQSTLDVILNSLSVAGRKTYLHRIVYVGEHTLPIQGRENIISVFERGVRQINEEYNDECLTGFFLAYSTQFVHILEGSEASLLSHTSTLADNDEGNEGSSNTSLIAGKISRTKVVAVYHHIHQRMLDSWMGAPAKPLRTLTKIGPDEDVAMHAAGCLSKLFLLVQHIRSQPTDTLRATLRNLSTRVAEHLPESSLLEFLLSAPMLLSVAEHSRTASSFLQRTLHYRENTWPKPRDMVPYSFFVKSDGEAAS